MPDPLPQVIRYPDGNHWVIRALRFVNILDDADNKLAPTKVSLWGSTLASFSTVFAAIVAWVTNHTAILGHILDVAPMVGTWWGGSAGAHHMDKRERNIQKVRMKEAE